MNFVNETNSKKLNKLIEKSKLKYPDGTDTDTFVECGICKLRGASISAHIKNVHNIAISEYKEKYGQTMAEVNLARVRGENNPAFNHGGRLSPFSKKFINYTSDEDITALCKRARKTCADNNNDSTKIEYYTSRGHSFEEANRLLSERQTTFSLEKCIEKHGETEGIKAWETRQNKWQDTLNSKTDKEKLELNAKRDILGYHTRWHTDESLDGYFYIISFGDSNIKVGITTKDSITKRYSKIHSTPSVKVILFQKATNVKHALAIEQLLIRKYRSNISLNEVKDFKQFGRYEIISGIDVSEVLIEATKYINDSQLAYAEFDEFRNSLVKKSKI